MRIPGTRRGRTVLTCAACFGCMSAACMAIGLLTMPEATVAMAILVGTAAVRVSPVTMAMAAFPGTGPAWAASMTLGMLLAGAAASVQVERFAWTLAGGGDASRRAFRGLVAVAVLLSVAFVAIAPCALVNMAG